MGRRSINTTKSGKYMNPTDQARKEARKKELKKNKKQRQMVRAAVLKNKDPSQILEEMEKIDEMEYNVLQPSPLNEKVLRDKRKKLKETFERVMRLYYNDDPEHWSELKRKEVEYEKKRLKKQQYYESVKHAQSVQIDEIPLPSSTQTPAAGGGAAFPTGPKRLPPPPTALSLPPFAPGAPPGALKKLNEPALKPPEKTEEVKRKEVLGVPIGPPPTLADMSDLDTDAEGDEVVLKKYVSKSKSAKSVPKPNSLQQRMLAISGQNIDDFMKEMENVHKKKVAASRGETESSKEGSKKDKDSANTDDDDDNDDDDDDDDDENKSDLSECSFSDEEADDDDDEEASKRRRTHSSGDADTAAIPTPASIPPVAIALPNIPAPPQPHISLHGHPVPPPLAGMAPPPPMMFRPPPRPPGMHGFGIRMPPGAPPGPRPPGMGGMPRMGIRIPGPPPGMPPRMAHHKMQQQQQQQQNKDSKGVTTITAKPQIRNLSADVTRFVPSTLRVKRDDSRKPNRTKPFTQEPTTRPAETKNAASKDDAYIQFMNEMQGLL
ncbi:uncharacterized protein [Musca autumnalis]|uniref:uncharacterized protein n=1 Tax=Musca autumnalis TaxID=221902 RepID=UPI003CEAA7B3